MDKRKIIARGASASRIMGEEVVQDAIRDLELMYISDWKTSKVDDVVKRERAYANMTVLNDFVAALQSYVDSGKIAGKQLERDSKL
jgi:hypothetical protein